VYRSPTRFVRTALVALVIAPALSLGYVSAPASAQPTPTLRAAALLKASAPVLASASTTRLAIDWPDFAGAPRYRVRYSKYASFKKSVYKRATSSKIVLSGLKASTKYYVRVQAIKNNAKGTALSVYSATKVFATAKKLKYAAPTSLAGKASARGSDAIALNWKFYKPGLRYQVQYARNKSFAGAKATIVRGPSTAITGLATSTVHYLRVRVVDAAGRPASGWSKVVATATRTPADPAAEPLQVASYNIRNGTKSTDTGNRSWAVRRNLVVKQIKGNKLDVVGLQEAEYTYLVGADGAWKHQYQDLVEVLGGSWRITCATEENPNCDKSNNYTAGTRLIYNSETVSLRQAGIYGLSTRSGDVRRFLVWGIFTQKSTGRDFFFANTHLDDAKTDAGYSYRVTQAKQVLAQIAANNPKGLPVILTGDMNSHKWRKPNNAPYKLYVAAGLVDPIGNTDFSRTAVKPTAEVRIRTEFDSWNNFGAKPDQHGWVNGINVDYVWVSKSVTTLEFETMVNISDATLKFVGPVPSDHNMLRASVLIPKS